MKWEQREKWAECIKTPDVPYAPPLGPPNPANPLCYFDVRAGGYYLGGVTFELKADTHPVTSENFVKLCEYKCYAGTMFQVFPGNWIRGGDFTELDEVIYDPADPEFFDFANLLPDALRADSPSTSPSPARTSPTSPSTSHTTRDRASSPCTTRARPTATGASS